MTWRASDEDACSTAPCRRCSPSPSWTTADERPARTGRHGVRRGVSARPVSTSGRTPPPSASSCLSQGERPTVRTARVYCPVGRADGGGGGGGQEIRHQPGGEPGGISGAAGDPADGICRPRPPSDTWTGFTAMDAAGLDALLERAGSCHGSGRPEVPAGLLPGRRRAGTPPSPRCGWWTPTGPTTAATPPSPPIIDQVEIHDAAIAGGLRAVSGRPGGGLRRGKGRQAASDPDGYGHHRRQGPEKAGPAAGTGRERGDQRLLHPCHRRRWTARTRTGC